MTGGNDIFVSAPGRMGLFDPDSGESATDAADGRGVVRVIDDRNRRLLEAIFLELKEHTRLLGAIAQGIGVSGASDKETVSVSDPI